jgi:hypothetical protein
MSWASRRKTTREEDIAYCLLGIFDISMPLLYGEGSKAFIRLQEQIIKEYDDESLFAWRSTSLGHTSGLLAPSPVAFARSANIVPCLTPAAMLSMSGPITVTSRGIRMEVPVERLSGYSPKAYLIRLNCKTVSVDRESGIRVGIIVAALAKIQGYPSSASMYGRIEPDRLHMFVPNTDLALQTVFLLKENNLEDFDLAAFDVFLIRTMPEWPAGLSYRLDHVEPLEAWDEKNETFRRPKIGNDDRPFVLVFRRDFTDSIGQCSAYFIVAVGREITTSHVRDGILGGRIWCDSVYRQVYKDANHRGVSSLELDAQLPFLSREEKTVEVKGDGMKLKCHVRPEIISGQPLFVVDLLVRDER